MNPRSLVLLMLALEGRLAAAQDSIPSRDTIPALRVAPGARVRVTTATGIRHAGRLVFLTDTSIVVRPDLPGLVDLFAGNTRIDRQMVARVEISGTAQRRATATALGTMVGAALGAFVGARSVHNPCTDPSATMGPCFDRWHGGMLGASLGAGLGWIVGRHLFGRDRWELAPVQQAGTAPGLAGQRPAVPSGR
jgi:hypothetical protein